jgi:hypothetical protein
MLQKIKLTDIVIIVLILVLFLQRCGKGTDSVEPKIIRDTTWVIKDSTITTKPQMVGTITVPVDRWNTEYLPDTNYTKLLAQYMDVTNKFLASNIYSDSLHIDSLGYVLVKDTVSKNMLIGRTFSYDIKYPIIKETRIIPEKKRNQFYLGGYVQGNEVSGLDELGAEILLKDKKDRMFGISAGLTTDGQIMYGVSSFWKIKLRK